jgi:outer membrane immunogenic protein
VVGLDFQLLVLGRREMKKILVVIGAVAAAGTASAADIPQPYSPTPVAVSPAYNWTGFYIGVMGGYGMSNRVTVNGIAGTNAGLKGGFVGSTLGFNYQSGHFVIGIEDDAAWSSIGKTSVNFGVTTQEQMLLIGSLTGRVGFAADNILVYGKGGYAYLLNDLNLSGFVGSAWEIRYHPGWTVGAGLEFGFAGNWSAKVEYMFARYLDEPYVLFGGTTLGADVHTIKAGINYRFGWGDPVVARY